MAQVNGGGASVPRCDSCLKARELGERLTRSDRMRVGGYGSVRAPGAGFSPVPERTPDSFRAGRRIPRDDGNEPPTFADTANMARGDKRLAALKADMDDMGVRVGQTVKDDPKYKLLKALSRQPARILLGDGSGYDREVLALHIYHLRGRTTQFNFAISRCREIPL